jgi:uncharacterized protein YndB with AHSA1/START domain
MSKTPADNSARPLLSDAPMGEVTEAPDGLQVVFHRRYRKSVEKVWAALTIPERLADWFSHAEVDLRVGGTIRFDGKTLHQTEMRIAVCDPPRALAWVWTIAGKESLVRWDLAADGEGCLLTLTHSGIPRVGEGARAGWHAHLEALPDALEGRATPWEVKTARETALRALYPTLSE